MIKHDPNCVSVKGQYGVRPIHKACEYGHLKTVKLLLDNQSDIDSK